MVKHALVFLFLSLVLVACGQATLAPTITPPATAQPSLTVTPTITVTPIPSATPFPTLSAERPYLIVPQYVSDAHLVVYDGSGQGRQTFDLPPGSDYYYSSFSPDGKWFAFYTGSLDYEDQKGDLPVMLHILNTADGTIHEIAEVVPTDSLQKLAELTKQLKNLYPDRYKPIDGWEWADRRIAGAFRERIFSMAWSPDSQMLAFAGQIDGLSSDVYLYEVASDSVRRLNDDLESVWSIGWSPDSKKILFENGYPGNTYTSSTLHILNPDHKVVKDPKTAFSSWFLAGGEWLSPNLFLVGQGSDTGGDSRLQALNVNTGQLSGYLWEDNFAGYTVVDPENETVLINSHEFSEPENYGLHLLSLNKPTKKIVDGLYNLNFLIFRGGEKHRFLLSGYSVFDASYELAGEIAGVTLDGHLTLLGQFDYRYIHISPDYAWMLIYDEEHLYLYDKNDELVKKFAISGIRKILWRPDSQTIAYQVDSRLYFLSIPDGTPKLVDNCGGGCILDLKNAVWLP